jgi:hypothetical protein
MNGKVIKALSKCHIFRPIHLSFMGTAGTVEAGAASRHGSVCNEIMRLCPTQKVRFSQLTFTTSIAEQHHFHAAPTMVLNMGRN